MDRLRIGAFATAVPEFGAATACQAGRGADPHQAGIVLRRLAQPRISIGLTRSPSIVKAKWLGPLKPRPPTCAATTTRSPSIVASVTCSSTATPMNSLSLQPLIASGPRKTRPQSSTAPSAAEAGEEAVDVVGVGGVDRGGHGRGKSGHGTTIGTGSRFPARGRPPGVASIPGSQEQP